MLNFVLGGAGCGKTSRMLSQIKADIGRGRRIYVIIPEQFSFEYERMLYRVLGASDFNKIEVRSFSRLSDDILRSQGRGSVNYADTKTKSALIFLAVKETVQYNGLSFYKKQSGHRDFCGVMLKALTDLRRSGLADEKLLAMLPAIEGPVADKLRDILNISLAYNRLLEKNGLKDSLTKISEAARAAACGDFFEGATVFIDEFKSFTGDERELLKPIITQTEVYLALDTDDVTKNDLLHSAVNHTYSVLKLLAQECNSHVSRIILSRPTRFKSPDLALLSRSVFRNAREEEISAGAIKIVEADDTYSECDYVCAEIRRMIMHGDCKYSEIAVVTRNASEYDGIWEASAHRYEIPYFMSVPKKASGTALSVFVSSLLELCGGRLKTETVLRYAKTGLCGLGTDDISELENYCFIWDIDGDMWKTPFNHDGAAPESVEAARKKLIDPILELCRVCLNASASEITEAVYAHFIRVSLFDNLEELALKYSEENADSTATLLRARDLRMLADSVCDILDVMHKTLNDAKLSISEYKALFESMLADADYSAPPQRLDSVSFSELHRTRLNAPHTVFIMGACEGVFPRNSLTGGAFTERDNRALRRIGIELGREDEQIYSEECFAVYSAVSAPSEKLCISYPLIDSAGKPCLPAYTLDSIKALFSNDIMQYTRNLDDEFFCSSASAAYGYCVRTLSRGGRLHNACATALKTIPEYGERIERLRLAGQSGRFESFPPATAKSLYSESIALSASKLETFCNCPFSFFMQYGLKIRPLRKKTVTVLERGNIVHFCLEKILSRYSREEFLALSRDELERMAREHVMLYRDEFLGGEFRCSGSFDESLEAIINNLVSILINLGAGFAKSLFYPVSFEHKIYEKIRLDDITGYKSEVRLNGSADRVDAYESANGKYLRILDYKTGVKVFSLSDLLVGRNMQMFIYLFSLTSQSGDYAGYCPSGVLYFPARESAPSLGRSSGEEELSALLQSNRKMNGIVLDDMCVLNAMEEGLNGCFIPVKLTKNGEIYKNCLSSVISAERLESVRNYCREAVRRCGGRILGGDIAALPLESSCDFCDYKSVCGNYPPSEIRSVSTESGLVEKMLEGNLGFGDAFDTEKADEEAKSDEEELD